VTYETRFYNFVKILPPGIRYQNKVSHVSCSGFLLSGRLNIFAMNQDYIRKKIVSLSKELAETTDYNQIKRLRRKIAYFKGFYNSTDPKSITDLIAGK
jgi:hypothetical protein